MKKIEASQNIQINSKDKSLSKIKPHIVAKSPIIDPKTFTTLRAEVAGSFIDNLSKRKKKVKIEVKKNDEVEVLAKVGTQSKVEIIDALPLKEDPEKEKKKMSKLIVNDNNININESDIKKNTKSFNINAEVEVFNEDPKLNVVDNSLEKDVKNKKLGRKRKHTKKF